MCLNEYTVQALFNHQYSSSLFINYLSLLLTYQRKRYSYQRVTSLADHTQNCSITTYYTSTLVHPCQSSCLKNLMCCLRDQHRSSANPFVLLFPFHFVPCSFLALVAQQHQVEQTNIKKTQRRNSSLNVQGSFVILQRSWV